MERKSKGYPLESSYSDPEKLLKHLDEEIQKKKRRIEELRRGITPIRPRKPKAGTKPKGGPSHV